MSDPRGGDQARSFRETLTSRVIPEAGQDGGEPPTPPPTVPAPAPEGETQRPPAWAAGLDAAGELISEPRQTPPIAVPNNIMLHAYRTLEPAELDALREVKDLALTLWNTLKQIDQSSAEDGAFYARDLGCAGQHLEECVLWVEKFFLR